MYSKKSNGWLKHLDFVLVDLIVMQIVYIVSYVIRHGLENPYDRTYYQVGALVILVTGVVFATLSDNYRNILKRSWLKELKASIIYVSALVIVLALYLLLSQTTFWYSRTVFVLLAILGVPAVYFGRLIWKKIVLAYRKKNGYSKKRMILVSSKDDFVGVKQRIEQKSLGDIEISGAVFFDDSTAEVGKKYDDVPVVGSLNDFTDNIVTDLVDEVMFVLPKGGVVPEILLQDLLNMGITSHVSISELYDNERGMKTIEKVGGYTVMTESLKIASGFQLALKRLMDIVGALVGLLITGILVIVIGPIIYFSDPGPIFFSQKRVGQNGRIFKIYKFRSMYQDAEERKKELMAMNTMKGFMFKADNDPRIIGSGKDGSKHGIGWFIRKTSLDEFPQFWNVLKGEMSLVGTRPPLIDEWKNYEKHHRARLAVRPGITGMWQVSGRSDITDFEKVIELDMKYIDNWSIFEDLKILGLTVKEVFSGEGSK